MTAAELRHALEAAYLSIYPQSTQQELLRYDFGLAVGIVLGNLPNAQFGALTAEDAKAIVRNLYAVQGDRKDSN